MSNPLALLPTRERVDMVGREVMRGKTVAALVDDNDEQIERFLLALTRSYPQVACIGREPAEDRGICLVFRRADS